MIRRTLRFGIRLGLLAGIGLGLFKFLQGRRSASELGSPSADWAPPPAPNPNLPKAPPEPELVTPVLFDELIEKKAAVRAVPPEVTIEPPPEPTVTSLISEPAVPAGTTAEKAPPIKRAAKKVAPAVAPAAAGPVKKVAPKKVAAKRAEPRVAGPPIEAPVAKKAAPVKKAPKKQL